jgi:hypothetical protein
LRRPRWDNVFNATRPNFPSAKGPSPYRLRERVGGQEVEILSGQLQELGKEREEAPRRIPLAAHPGGLHQYVREGLRGTEIIGELTPLPSENVITKHKISPFFNTDLDAYLKPSGVDELIIGGARASSSMESCYSPPQTPVRFSCNHWSAPTAQNRSAGCRRRGERIVRPIYRLGHIPGIH